MQRTRAEQIVPTAGQYFHLWNPVATRHQRVHTFERYQPWSVVGVRSFGNTARTRASSEATSAGAVQRTGGVSDSHDALKNLWYGAGAEDQQLRRRLDAVEGALDISSGGIADVTGVLGQHKVGGFLAQYSCLDVKGASARSPQRAHLGLHLGATEHSGINEAPADHRFVLGFSGIVTEITDSNQLIAEAKANTISVPLGSNEQIFTSCPRSSGLPSNTAYG